MRQVDSFARALVDNSETTSSHHSTQHYCKQHPARHPGGQETTGPPEKNWLDNLQECTHRDLPTLLRTGHAALARTVCEWHPYDRPGQGVKMKVTTHS